ncbi:MAG: hypothetical protein AAF367_04440 [Pseudomonadota bacterium]
MRGLTGRIAIIGWGSLIWDLDDLASKVEGDWLMGAGPVMPFEFSRVSPKRKRALAVCIDPAEGDPCPTSAILSARDDIHMAAEDLRARERAPRTELIGLCCARTGTVRSRISALIPVMEAWCTATGAAGAVWTDLNDNYATVLGRRFSISDAIAYLKALPEESREEAVRYITFAPQTTDTKLRRALTEEAWWQAEVARFT